MKHFLQNVRRLPAHDDQAIRQRRNLLHHRALIGIGITKHRVQGGDDRHMKAAQKLEDVRAGRSAENSVFVLQAYQINVAEIQEIRGLAIRNQLILGKLEAHAGGIGVTLWRIVHRQRQQFRGAIFSVNRVAQIRCKRGDSTPPRKIVPDDGDPAWQQRAADESAWGARILLPRRAGEAGSLRQGMEGWPPHDGLGFRWGPGSSVQELFWEGTFCF